MDERTLHALEAQRGELHARWDALLRVEPVNSPLAHPEALKHMIDFTLLTLFGALRNPHVQRRKHLRSVRDWVADRAMCPCGRNPLLAYFVAGEQALLETLILVQAGLPDCLESRSASVLELKSELAHVAHREIETFCTLCQLRAKNGGGAHDFASHARHRAHATGAGAAGANGVAPRGAEAATQPS